jgi:tetratricopeptide (TPR) repeat protein
MFETVVAARPDEASPVIFLAWAQHENGDTPAALKTLSAAEKRMPGRPFLAYNRGQFLMAQNKSDGAFDAYVDAIDAAPEFTRDLYIQINDRAFRGAGFTPGQREKLWTALWTKWPDQFEAPNAAGLWYRDTANDYKQSAAWYPRAVEANPESPQVLNDTALILDQYLGEHEMAEPYYRRAIAAGEAQGRDFRGGDGSDYDEIGYRDAINNFGRMLRKQERWKDLMEFCEKNVPEGHGGREGWMKAAKKGGA